MEELITTHATKSRTPQNKTGHTSFVFMWWQHSLYTLPLTMCPQLEPFHWRHCSFSPSDICMFVKELLSPHKFPHPDFPLTCTTKQTKTRMCRRHVDSDPNCKSSLITQLMTNWHKSTVISPQASCDSVMQAVSEHAAIHWITAAVHLAKLLDSIKCTVKFHLHLKMYLFVAFSTYSCGIFLGCDLEWIFLIGISRNMLWPCEF